MAHAVGSDSGDRDLILPRRLATLAAEHPEVVAITDVAGPALTWGQLHLGAQRWAAGLASVGARPGQMIATMLPNSPVAFLSWIGTASTGAVEVPVNNLFRGFMLRHVLQDSGAEVLVIAQSYLPRLLEVMGELTHLRTVVVHDAEGPVADLPFRTLTSEELLAAGGSGPVDLDFLDWHHTGAMIYTSGTTGPSKGVLVPWALLYQSPLMMQNFLRPDEAFYSTYPPFHISGKYNLYNAAVNRCHLVLRESFSASCFWDDVRRFDVKSTPMVGSVAALLMAQPDRPDDADNPLVDVMMGPLLPDTDAFMARFGIERVCTAYGMTELGLPLSSGFEWPNTRTCGRVRTGPPGFELRLVDDHDIPVPYGTVGELVARSADPWVITPAYWGRPDATAEAWRNGWFHTGDAFTQDEAGWFYFVDRRKDALRRRGENISSFELEAAIGAHPDVLETAVVAVPSPMGEDDVKAVIVPAAGSALTESELVGWLDPRLPTFMVPRYVEFVEELPKTEGTLRVQKHLLRENARNDRTWDRESASPQVRGGR